MNQLKKDSSLIEDYKIVIKNLPVGTDSEEIGALIKHWVPSSSGIAFCSFFYKENKQNQEIHVTSFVKLYSNEDRDLILNYYFQNKGKKGVMFTNDIGLTKNITFDYSYMKKTVSKRESLKCSVSEEFFSEITDKEILYNRTDDEKLQKKEKEVLINYIEVLEETLRKKCPLLFTSQFEMLELRNEKKCLDKEIEEKQKLLNTKKDKIKDIKLQFRSFSFNTI